MNKSQKIFTQLITSFSLIIVLVFILGIGSVVITSIISGNAKTIYENHLLGIEYAGNASTAFEMSRQCYLRAITGVLFHDQELIDSSKTQFDEMNSLMTSNISAYKSTGMTSEAAELIKKVETDMPEYLSQSKILFEEVNNAVDDFSNVDEMVNLVNVMREISEKLGEYTDDLVLLESSLAKTAYERSSRTASITNVANIALLIAIIAASLFIAFKVAISIEKQLKVVVDKITESTKIISMSSNQLAEASDHLASGSSKQAASIEETSATMNESASMIAQNAENTRQAAMLADHAKELADKGMQKMNSMVVSMQELKESSDNISRIIKTIDEIAFQTNLLAINATVEAARAGGEAGQSFAVVAQEVRSLAQKSAQAAADTGEIVERNITLTNTSRDESRMVAESLMEVTQEFENLGRLISEINAAGEEQSNGIKQINIAISEMEKVTQQNAAVAQQNAASSNNMSEETLNLREAVDIANGMIRQ